MVNRPLLRATGCAASRLEAVERQLDSTLDRLIWRRQQEESSFELPAPAVAGLAARGRRGVSRAYPPLFLIGSSARS